MFYFWLSAPLKETLPFKEILSIIGAIFLGRKFFMVKLSRLLFFAAVMIYFSRVIVSPALCQEVKVGVILPLSGKLASAGHIEEKSYLMAAKEINGNGGIDGQNLELIIEDTAGKREIAHSVMEKLISQDNVLVICGGVSSSATLDAAGLASQFDVPFLINTASADKITELRWKNIFRLNPPVSEYQKALASFLTEVTNVRTVVILSKGTLSQYASRKFLRLCKKLGLRVEMKASYSAGDVDFRPLLIRIKGKRPDLIYMISNELDASLLMRQAKELGLIPKLFIGQSAAFTLPAFQKNAEEASEYVYSPTLWAPSAPYPGARDYCDKFVAEYGSIPEYHGAEAYSAMYVIADAMRRAKALTREDVRDALVDTDIMTPFGPVKFESYGKKTQQNKLPTLLVQWQNGRLETVWPKDIASAKYIYPTPR